MQGPVPSQLVARYGSPLYVYDAELVRERYRAFTAAFRYPGAAFYYAIVCNKNAHLVRILRDLGAGIHANTPGDAYCALSAGVPPGRIVYSGSNLGADDFRFILERGIFVHVDSLDQLRDFARLAPAFGAREVGVRLLIDDPSRPNRIGVAETEIDAALRIAREFGLRLTSLHMYAGTNTRRASRFLDCLDRLLAAGKKVPDLATIDIGGGFGVGYRESEVDLDLNALGAAVTERLQKASLEMGRSLNLAVEPGRTLVGPSGSLLVTVLSVKERGGRRYVGVDSTVGNIVVPSVYHPHHRVEAVAPRGAVVPIPTDLCGNTTHSRDYLGRSLSLPELFPGDLLRICDVGAYGYAMSSHFLNRPRPAEVVLDGDNVTLTTRRETFADLMATQEAP